MSDSGYRADGTQPARLHGRRVLIAEDDPASLELVQAYMELQGCEVVAAPDGNRALDMAASGKFELAILDVHMPLYSGVEVLQMLRKRYLLHPIKVIALTADPTQEVRDELQCAAIDCYMNKPVSLADLGDEAARLLATPADPLGASAPLREVD